MFKNFLKANRSWLIFLTAMLLVITGAYKAQASDEEPLKPVQVEYKTVETESNPGEEVEFIQWVGKTYRLVIDKTTDKYSTFKQELADGLEERRILAGVHAKEDFKLNFGDTYQLERLDGSSAYATFTAPPKGKEDTLNFSTVEGNMYSFSSSGKNLNNGLKDLQPKDHEWALITDDDERAPTLGKVQPVSDTSATN